MKKFLIFFLLLFLKAPAQKQSVLVYFHTRWCAVCRSQDKILKESHLDEKSKNIRFIAINPETDRESIHIFGKEFKYLSNGMGGIHEIIYFANGNKPPVYPYWVLFSPEGKIIFRYEGILKKEILSQIVR